VRVFIQYCVITSRATGMADTNIDAIKKQKEAEYDRQYRLTHWHTTFYNTWHTYKY